VSALAKQRRFEALRAALGLVEERGAVSIDELARSVDLDAATLADVLHDALYVDYYDASGHLVSESNAFLLSDGTVSLQQDHWLRDLEANPPKPDDALRLLLAGLAWQAVTDRPTPDLDAAVTKLRGVVACELLVDVHVPAALHTVRVAIDRGRSLRIRYLHDGADAPEARELLPHKVWSRWGHWYLTARDVREDDVKQFRVDRMVEADVGDTEFSPPAEVELPEWFDLAHHERTVRVRMRADSLESLPAPHRLGEQTELGDGRVELDITVVGDHRLEHLLLCFAPDDEIVAPAEYAERRRKRAAALLRSYEEQSRSARRDGGDRGDRDTVRDQ